MKRQKGKPLKTGAWEGKSGKDKENENHSLGAEPS